MLSLRSVTQRYGGLVALDDVSLEVRPREIVCIVGPSGGGKSTLLHILAGLVRPTEGRVAARRPV